MTQSRSKTVTVKVLGITGGVGAGKSTVLKYLEEKYGARLLLCDEIARELQQPGGPCYEPMVEMLGKELLCPDGTFDRGEVAERVFANPALLQQLNGIVHPAVKKWVKAAVEQERTAVMPESAVVRKNRAADEQEGTAWMQEKAGASGTVHLVVIEAALLLEERYDLLCDEIWYVFAEEQVRRRRLRSSRGYTEARMDDMMARQQPDGFFREHCQFVVDNSSDNVENTYEQIDKGLKKHGFL